MPHTWRMTNRLPVALALLFPVAPAWSQAAADFVQLAAKAQQEARTEPGQAYRAALRPLLKPVWDKARRDCPHASLFSTLRGEEPRYLLRLDAQGRLTWSGIDKPGDASRCALELLQQVKFPSPPHDDYLLLLRRHSGGPGAE